MGFDQPGAHVRYLKADLSTRETSGGETVHTIRTDNNLKFKLSASV
jgi:hypothetical protein